MDVILLNFFILTVFSKTLGTMTIFGLNFAPWDLFILYPIFMRRLLFWHDIKYIYFALILFFLAVLLSTLTNFLNSCSFIGLCLQITRNLFILDLFCRIGARFYEKPVVKTLTIWGFFVPIVHLCVYFTPLQSIISEPSVGNFMRLEGFVGDANFFAFSILLLGLSVSKYRILLLPLILACILLSGSRSALGLWFILFYIFFRNYRFYILIISGLPLAIFHNEILNFITKFENFYDIFSRSIMDFSRIRYWIKAFNIYDSQFLFGNGPKSFVTNIGNFSHNDFITAYYEYGLFGFVFFTLLMGRLIRLPFPNRFGSNIDLQISYFSIFLVLNLFSFWLFPHIWVLQGFLIGISYKNKRKDNYDALCA